MANRARDLLYCFVPSESIDIVILATYLKAFIDATASIKPTKHPRDDSKYGYTVGASKTLNRENLQDLIKDTRAWIEEQQTAEFNEGPYDYQDSDAWQARKRAGMTKPKVEEARVVEPRRRGGRHDSDRYGPENPRTGSDTSRSTGYTQQSSIFSRDEGSTFSTESLDPSDSVSNYGYSSGNKQAPAKGPPPRPPPGPNNPHPHSMPLERDMARMNVSDNKPNQSATVRQSGTATSRHAAVADDRATTSNRIDPTRPPGRKENLYKDSM